LKVISEVLVGLGLCLVIDGVFSIVKYPKQSFPEQLARALNLHCMSPRLMWASENSLFKKVKITK